MRSARSFAGLSSVALSLVLLAGCGDEMSSPVVTVGPTSADADAAPDAPEPSRDFGGRGDAVATFPKDTPFAHAFVATSDVACSSQGATKLRARFPGDAYQFSSCSFTVQRTSEVRGDVTVTAEGWTVTATARGASDLDVAFTRPSDTFDWNDAPVVLHFAFQNAEGKPARALRTLRPVSGPEVLTLGAPRLARTRLAALPDLTTSAEHEARLDATGVPVLRAHEALAFEAPFALAPNVEGYALAGTYLAQPDRGFRGDKCVFSDFLPKHTPTVFVLDRSAWRAEENGRFVLFAAGDATFHEACAPEVAPSERQTGRVTFNPHMGGYKATSPFAVRLVPRALDEDAKLRMHAVGPVLEGFEAINIAPYSLQTLRVDLTLACATDESMRVTATLGVPPERRANGLRPFYRALPIDNGAKWDIDAVRGALRHAVNEARAKCERHAWTLSTARVVEGDGASWTRLIPLEQLEVVE